MASRSTTVFRIVNEGTRAARGEPVDQGAPRRVVVGLANHTILIQPGRRRVSDRRQRRADPRRARKVSGCVLIFRDVRAAADGAGAASCYTARLLAAIVESS